MLWFLLLCGGLVVSSLQHEVALDGEVTQRGKASRDFPSFLPTTTTSLRVRESESSCQALQGACRCRSGLPAATVQQGPRASWPQTGDRRGMHSAQRLQGPDSHVFSLLLSHPLACEIFCETDRCNRKGVRRNSYTVCHQALITRCFWSLYLLCAV